MANLLLEDVDYKIEKTPRGIWRRYMYPTGAYYAEFTSHRRLFGLPLIHYTRGISPETGRRVTARGIIAVGRVAVGGLAIGQAAFGLLAIGQLSVGALLGFGQAAAGFIALGQMGLGVWFGAGQVATGAVAIGQLALGEYVLAQVGIGEHVWSQHVTDPEAVAYFKALGERCLGLLRSIAP